MSRYGFESVEAFDGNGFEMLFLKPRAGPVASLMRRML
jgi:hypothetical protein